ncbi:MAG: B12-binding domain-containing radical SAM protein [Myxococcota bacterium]
MKTSGLDLLLTHAYYLCDDPHEAEIMRPFPPLGLQYLVAFLKANLCENVDWLDATFHDSPENFQSVMEIEKPRAVGFYGHTITRPRMIELVHHSIAQGCRVMAGGPDPVQYLDEYFEMGVEVIVIGEGEHTLLELMQHLKQNNWQWDWESLHQVNGIAFCHGGTIVRTKARRLIRPLDVLPWPERRRKDLEPYLDAWRQRHGETALSMVTSRGCPYHCSWCSKQVYGDTFRRRSVDDVIDELMHLKAEYNPDQIWFADDLFTINKSWIRRFCSEMVRRKAVTPFYIIGRPETFTQALCEDLKKAGCFRVYLSAESGSQLVLDAMHKDDRVEHIITATRLLQAAGIEVGFFVMIGYPGERWVDLKATVRMLHALQPDVTLLSVAHPMKGTQFYEQVENRLTPQRNEGGRLAFEQDYSPLFYDWVQRWIWSETKLVQDLKNRRLSTSTIKNAIKTPIYRLSSASLARIEGALRGY